MALNEVHSGGSVLVENAKELFKAGYCCSEAVLLAIAKGLGIESDLIPKIATGFCGGIAHTGNLCGAVSGAVMGISLATGRHKPQESRVLNHALTKELLQTFQREFGAIECERLIGLRLDTEEGYRLFHEKNIRGERCVRFVCLATELAASLIARASTQHKP